MKLVSWGGRRREGKGREEKEKEKEKGRGGKGREGYNEESSLFNSLLFWANNITFQDHYLFCLLTYCPIFVLHINKLSTSKIFIPVRGYVVQNVGCMLSCLYNTLERAWNSINVHQTEGEKTGARKHR